MAKYKPKQIIYQPIGGKWQDVAGDSGTLAETLERFGIIIDDKCEFARFINYEQGIGIWYRAEEMRIILTVFILQH